MTDHPRHIDFPGRIVMVGFGSIGQGVLPLLLRHTGVTADRIVIVAADPAGREIAEELGVAFRQIELTPANLRPTLEPLLGEGDFLLNLSVDVKSVALVALAHDRGALYLDTCIEPWPGGYIDPSIPAHARTNYALREEALAYRAREAGPGTPTALLTHGANPGLVSHLVKQALLDIAAETGHATDTPTDRQGWAALAQALGIRTIHVAERDTQVCERPKEVGEFVNTWSIDGFVGEGKQPAELGWGTHERHFPADGHRHRTGSKAAIYLARPGASVRVRSWTPLEGPYHGFLITHNESISIADYLTVGAGDAPTYRPTVHYAYHPADDAVLSVHELAGKNWQMQSRVRLIVDEITTGVDELGVLLAGHAKGAYWYGSQLSIEETRRLVPYNNATSLQVTAAVLAGFCWVAENPRLGIVEPEDMDHAYVLRIAGPYLGPVVGAFSDWTPLEGRGALFPEDIDPEDPWQFKNIRVV